MAAPTGESGDKVLFEVVAVFGVILLSVATLLALASSLAEIQRYNKVSPFWSVPPLHLAAIASIAVLLVSICLSCYACIS